MNNEVKGDTFVETDRNPSKKRRRQDTQSVVHLVFARKSPAAVVGEELADSLLQLPRAKLPIHTECSEREKEHEIEMLIKEELGIRGYVMRKLWDGFDSEIQIGKGVGNHSLLLVDTEEKEFELQTPLKWIPQDVATNGRWVNTIGDKGSSLINIQLEDLFDKMRRNVLVPWKTVGWIEKLISWTRRVLKERNMVMIGRLQRRHLYDRSSVMSCDVKTLTDRESEKKEFCEVLFIKSYFRVTREGQRTTAVREVLGEIVPEVLGFCNDEGIMIQRDGGVVADAPLDQESVINTILKMQMLSMDRLSELESGGLLVADSEWVESHVDWILHHKVLDTICEGRGDDAKQIVDQLRSRTSDIQRSCRKITSFGLKNTIVHGDLYMQNVGSPVEGEEKLYRFFDWAEAFIGNPLHDFNSLLEERFEEFKGYSMNKEAGLAQVLEYWKPCATLGELESMFPFLDLMSELIKIYQFIQQYEAVSDSEICVRDDALGQIFFAIEVINHVSNELFSDRDDKPR